MRLSMLRAIAATAMVVTMGACTAQAQPEREQDASVPAIGPRGSVGPDVPLSDAENERLAKRVTVEGRTGEAVQAACDKAAEEAIVVVFLPAGEYVFDAEVKVPGGLTVLGEGSKTICRAKEMNTHLFRADGDLVRFTRLKLHGADTTTNSSNNSYGITISGVQNCRIDHCELLGFSYATTPSNECTAQIDHCYIHHDLRNGLGYGTSIYSGAYVLIADNEFEQNRHSLASNGALDWSSHKRLGKFIHRPEYRRTHWEFVHNRVGSNDLSEYELCSVDTHPGMDGTFVVEGNIFENLRHGVGIRDGAGLIRCNLFRNLRTRTSFRALTAISMAYGEHNGVPVDGCMPHSIQVAENSFLGLEDKQKYVVGKAENITIEGKLVPETRTDREAPQIPWLQEMGEDGVLGVREARPAATGIGSVTGVVTDEGGKPVGGATVLIGDRSATTDPHGQFAFREVSEAARFVVVSKAGFEPALPELEVRPGQLSTVKVRLLPDLSPPVFLDLGTSALTHNSATISWETNKPTTAEATHGLKVGGDEQTTKTGGEPATTHRVELTDLSPSTTYRVRLKATDVGGNEAMREELVFSTAPTPDATPPNHWGYYVGGGRGLWGRTEEEAHSGKFSAYLKATAHSRGSLNIALVAGESNGYSGPDAYPAEPGATYQYSFWTKGDFKSVGLVLMTWNTEKADMKARGHENLMKFSPTEEWERHEGEFTIPEDTKKFVLMFKVYLDGLGSEDLGVLYVDDVEVTTGQTQVVQNGGAENP